MTDPVVLRVAQILDKKVDYPWKTAQDLRQRLAGEGIAISTDELRNALLEHASREGRVVRYSFFPARDSLDLLWGHVNVVQDRANLPAALQQAEFGEFGRCSVPAGRPWCFLSHSFLDLPTVRPLYEQLLARGYGVWLAEAEVLTGMMIVKAAREALDICDRFVLVATPNSIASRWVLKEALNAIGRWSLPVTVVVDGSESNREMIDLFGDWVEDRWDETIAQRVNRLESGEAADPAATEIGRLIVPSLGAVPPERRVVVLEPFPPDMPRAAFRSIDDEFPRLE